MSRLLSFISGRGPLVRQLFQASCFGLLAIGALNATAIAPKAKSKALKKTIEYNRDVRPILSKCFACHGHDAKEVKAGLRLDEREDAIKDLGGGERAITPYSV